MEKMQPVIPKGTLWRLKKPHFSFILWQITEMSVLIDSKYSIWDATGHTFHEKINNHTSLNSNLKKISDSRFIMGQ